MKTDETVMGPVAVNEAVKQAIATACGRVAPLWPLRYFVAVNPFWGMVEKPFAEAVGRMKRVSHSPLHMGGRFYAQAIEDGRITDEEIRDASLRVNGGDVPARRHSPKQGSEAHGKSAPDDKILTFADALDATDQGERSEIVRDEISQWCSAYFDAGQAAWANPAKKLSLFQAWQQWASVHRGAEIRGLMGMRELSASLPDDAEQVITQVLNELQIPEAATEVFLHRQLMSIQGWAAYTAQLVREDGLYERTNLSLVDLLAVRLVFDLTLARSEAGFTAGSDWQQNVERCAAKDTPWQDAWAVWQEAYELGFQREFFSKWNLSSVSPAAAGAEVKRPEVQAVFCIDVRSEVFRRALESVHTGAETIGFAGFFGFALNHVPLGLEDNQGTSLCPVLLTPGMTTQQGVKRADAADVKRILESRSDRKVAGRSWKSFKVSPVSSFSFVETCGLAFASRLIKDGFAKSSPGTTVEADGFTAEERKRLKPLLPGDLSNEAELKALAATAFGALKNMGLTENFARVVMVCGHGSSTANNPYGSALDCGACGGHAGGTNARVAATALNLPEIRALIAQENQVIIPEDTLFIAAQHDTTTDQIQLFDCGANYSEVPASHQQDVQELVAKLEQATRLARTYRAPGLGLSLGASNPVDELVTERSRDWAQVRPEWGLAGNAAFIAAPRERTKGFPLNSRVFLHNYHPKSDPDKSILELICCAPMVVANWINMQYYASTVDNDVFGSGNKVTHNVVGTVGILQGNSGDLQVGLPWQSIHNGTHYVHEPLRLNVIIETETADLDAVIAKHEVVRQLVENQWLHLFALEPDGTQVQQYQGAGKWQAISSD